jgi:hypothetical protein
MRWLRPRIDRRADPDGCRAPQRQNAGQQRDRDQFDANDAFEREGLLEQPVVRAVDGRAPDRSADGILWVVQQVGNLRACVDGVRAARVMNTA